MKRARAAGLDIVGVYHTHPDHPAEPSAYDRDTAAPRGRTFIVSVREGRAADVRSWCIADLEAPFVEEQVLET